MSIELMAPVSNNDTLIAALSSGADSVYLGYKEFNARIVADNFTNHELEDAIKLIHEKGKKGYLVFNTLLKDSEFERAITYLNFAIDIGVDGIIIQDLGIINWLRNKPVPLFASTQMTICNSRGVNIAKLMGFKRVVLARELNINDIASVSEKTKGIELECFIHGGLCIGYSGQCAASTIFEHCAANRGICKTPCWEDYALYCDNQLVYSGKIIKPKDMYAIHHISRLNEMGISALKIQGRSRSVSYVTNVVKVYREYIDFLENDNHQYFSQEKLDILKNQSPRGLMKGNLELSINNDFVVHSKPCFFPALSDLPYGKCEACRIPEHITVSFTSLENIVPDQLFKGIERIYLSYDLLIEENKTKILKLSKIASLYMIIPILIERYDVSAEYIERKCFEYNISGISISNVGDLLLINKIDCEFSAERSLNICNVSSANYLKDFGIKMISLPFELQESEMIYLSNNVDLKFERTVYGRPKLIQMKYCILTKSNECLEHCEKCKEYKKIILSGKKSFIASINPSRTETTLYPYKRISMPIWKEDVYYTRLEFTDETIDHINHVLASYHNGFYFCGEYIDSIGSI